MRKIYVKTALLGLTAMLAVQAREIRTPLPFEYGFMRYPIEYTQDREKDDCWFNWIVRGVGYARDADCAFSTCDGRCKVPWINLLFGSSEFTLAQAFPNAGAGIDFSGNPFAAISTLTPKFDYHEKGAMFIAEVSSEFCRCDTNYRYGLRARLPVRDIQVKDICGLGGSGGLEGESLGDVFLQRDETIGTEDAPPNMEQENFVFAARLDFLSQLLRVAMPPENLVHYGTGIADPTQIADITVGIDTSTVADDNVGVPAIALIRRDDGSAPIAQRWGDRAVIPTTVPAGTPPSTAITGVVAGDGSGLANNQRGKFNASNNYTPLSLNVAAQSQLWVVPTLRGGLGADENTMSAGALQIQSEINQAILGLSTVSDFLTETGLNFCDGRTKGVGDLILEFYLGRNWFSCNQVWTDLVFAVSFPTGDRLCNCLDVLKQPLGNNGHFEIQVGLEGGYDWSERVKFMADFRFSKVLCATERVAAPFVGATLKNIGPCINANVEWWWFLGHFDVTFFANDCCGLDIGYELYHKGCDKICLCPAIATDLLGNANQLLDPAVLRRLTEVTAHKIRLGWFTVINNCEIFAGWSNVIAGKNAPVETDWYLSMAVSF